MEPQEKSFLEAFDEKKNVGTLRVLTVLTFIGCGVEFIGAIINFAFAKYLFDTADKYLNQGNPDNLPSYAGKSYTPEVFETLKKGLENRVPILVIGLVATTLCLIGAIKMRNLKADGYWLWLVGELLPYGSILFFIGTGAFSKPISLLLPLVPITFIVLYTSQRKHLS
jgi:hypothetical protein